MRQRITASGASGVPNLARQNIVVLAEQAYELWLREFSAALPERFRPYFGATRWLLFDQDSTCKQEQCADLRPVAIAVDAHKILFRQIELPLVASAQLARLMQFELRQHVPLPLDQVVTDFRIIERHSETSRMRVELAIMRRETVQEALAQAKAKGVEPDALAIPSEHGLWFARRPAQIRWQDAWRRPRLQRWAVKLAVPAGLALLCIGAAQSWAERFATSRAAEVLTLQQQAAPIASLRQQLTVLNAKLATLAQTRTRPLTAAVTEEVAKLLPDDAWLQELDIEDQSVTLRGTAQHATALLKIFSGSPLFSNVQFEAPLTQAYNGSGQQFDITMTRN